MRLGSDTTSYTNYLLAKPRSDEPAPREGMGATVLRRHDRVACTITEIFTYRDRLYVRVQEDAVSANQEGLGLAGALDFACNPAGATYVFFKSQNGYWQHVHHNKKRRLWEHSSAYSLRIGERLNAEDAEGQVL